MAGNDHVIDILTSKDVENISLIFQYLCCILIIAKRTSERSERVSLAIHHE